jgi:hypothetical protein
MLPSAGCPGSLARPPVARIRLEPAVIPEGDGFRTVVTLDGTGSCDECDAANCPLAFEWSFEQSDARVEPGDALTSPVVRVRFAGTSPPQVLLRVRAPDGRGAEAFARVALTLTRDR